MAKGKIEAKAERRCARCKKLSRAMLKNREGHHSDDAVKKGGMNCDVKKLRCASLRSRVAALWCTKFLKPEVSRIFALVLVTIAGSQSTTLFGDHPFSIKHPQDNFSLQNTFGHPPKCKLTPSKEGLATSNLQLLHRNTQTSPLANLYVGGRQFAFLEAEIVLGVLYRKKGGTPKKSVPDNPYPLN